LTKKDNSDDAPATVSIWRVATGELVGTQAAGPSDQLLSTMDDGTAVLEMSGTTTWMDPKTGASRPLFKSQYARSVVRPSDLYVADRDGQVWTLDRNLQVTTLKASEALKSKFLMAASRDGKTAYVSDLDHDYFVELENGDTRTFFRGVRTGGSAFSRSGKFAIVAKVGRLSLDEIQIWDPAVPVRITSYQGDWTEVKAVWFSDDESELWALDNYGKLHRWSLSSGYAVDVAAACSALREGGARLQFTEAELAAFPMLTRQDKHPCLRTGPLSVDYYVALLREWTAALTDK
jgi:hypothetical protein